MMHDYNNWESLVVPFAEAVCAMSNQSLGVLGKTEDFTFENTFTILSMETHAC